MSCQVWALLCWPVLLLLPTIAVSIELSNIPIKDHKYEYNGYGNNIENPTWGAVDGPRVRYLPDEDGFFQRPGVPRSEDNGGLPSARRIMEELFRFPALKEKKASTSTNDFKLIFGMTMSSDSLTAAGTNESEPFDLTGDGNFSDGVFCPVTGQFESARDYDKSFPRYNHQLVVGKKDNEPVRATTNSGTAFLDLGCIYGNSVEENEKIRNQDDPKLFDLVNGTNGLLPRQPYLRSCFGAVPASYALQVVWMRLHNHVAEIIANENAGLNDEQVFQAARNYVIATYQKIALTKYVPALLGDSMGRYPGYNSTIDPSIDEYFAGVTYRYGHSEQPNVIRLADEDFLPTSQDPILMRDAYQKNPQKIVENAGGIEKFIRGAIITPTKPFDYAFEDDLNFYSKATSMVDVQRSRDVGIPPYNQAREKFGLKRYATIRELVEASGYYNEDLVSVMENLYGNDIEKVDSYVGTLFEKPSNADGLFGPSLTASTRDQINRIRTGDRFWYEKEFNATEIAALPSMTDVIKLVCTGMDKFPETFFRVYGSGNEEDATNGEDESCIGRQSQVGLLGGEVVVKWTIDQSNELEDEMKSSIELTLTANVKMEGAGYLGIGWRSRKMAGADIWICTVDPDVFGEVPRSANCDESQTSPPMFSCCLASGANVRPECRNADDPSFYELDVVNWCLSEEESSVTINAQICNDGTVTDDCFDISSNPDGTMDMIVSFNPNDQNKPHGFLRRTSTVVDLKAGILTAAEAGVASAGLIAYHGITMLAFWMLGAPVGIYVVRYMKTKSWRLAVHISIMGAVGGLTIPIIVGIESAVGASSDKTQEHSFIGLILTFLILPMFLAGRIRYSQLQGFSVSRRVALWAYVFHKIFGYAILIFAWWNCYTGLVRISPADSFFQLVVLSSYSFGYDVPIFGVFKNNIFWPYLSIVVLIFAMAEIRKRVLNHRVHASQLLIATKTIWDDGNVFAGTSEEIQEMERGKFLELVRLGTPLCIIDGRVLDLTGFLEHHPGGSDMLEGVAGTDISAEIKGLRAIEGFCHKHSYIALQKMRSLVIASIVEDANKESVYLPTAVHSENNIAKQPSGTSLDVEHDVDFLRQKVTARIFRRARIIYASFVTPSHEVTADNKPVVMLYLAAPKRPNIDSQDVIIPSSAYRFRITNPWGTTFEAYYTPVRLQKSNAMRKDGLDVNDDEEVLEFLISLRAGGQLQKSCMSWTIGKTLPIFGPTVNLKVLQQLGTTPRSKSLILFAAGTGIAPMLQLIDFYSPKRMKDSPSIFLIWILKSPMHNYNEWIGLGEHVKVFKRKFRWVVLYSSKKPVVDVAALKGTTGTTESRRPRDKQPFYKRFQTRKLGDMQGKDPLDFSHRLSAEGALDELSLRGDPSDDEKNDMDEAPAVNDVFWRVHGNKCMSMKLNQELVSSLVSASEVELSQERANFRGSEDSNKNGTKVHTGSNMVAYVCGSPGFDSCIRDWLMTGGFPKDQIVDFYSSPTVHV